MMENAWSFPWFLNQHALEPDLNRGGGSAGSIGIYPCRTVARKEREDAARFMAGLTQCQKQTMDMVLAGCPSKNVAAERGISHRAGVKSLPALARLAIAATG